MLSKFFALSQQKAQDSKGISEFPGSQVAPSAQRHSPRAELCCCPKPERRRFGAFVHLSAAANTQTSPGHIQMCPCFEVGGLSLQMGSTLGSNNARARIPLAALCYSYTFSLCLPSSSSCNTEWQVQVSTPALELVGRALRTPQQPAVCVGFLVGK